MTVKYSEIFLWFFLPSGKTSSSFFVLFLFSRPSFKFLLPSSFLFLSSDLLSNFSNVSKLFFFSAGDDDNSNPPFAGGPRSHCLQISQKVPGAACRGPARIAAPAGAGGDAGGRDLGFPQPGGVGVGGRPVHVSPPISLTLLSKGFDGGGGGPPGGGFVQADADDPDEEE